MNHRSYLIGTSVLLTFIFASPATTSYAQKHVVSKFTHIRVTTKRVYGHTTRQAKVTIFSSQNKKLGSTHANRHGSFVIKTKKNLSHTNFKLKATKAHYQPMVKIFKFTSPNPSQGKTIPQNDENSLNKSTTSNVNTTKPNTKNISTNSIELESPSKSSGLSIEEAFSPNQLAVFHTISLPNGAEYYEGYDMTPDAMNNLKTAVDKYIQAQNDEDNAKDKIHQLSDQKRKLENYMGWLKSNETNRTIDYDLHKIYLDHYDEYAEQHSQLVEELFEASSHYPLYEVALADASSLVRSALPHIPEGY